MPIPPHPFRVRRLNEEGEMKYQVELRRSFSQWGTATIEAENDGHAAVVACTLQAGSVPVWKTPDEFLEIVSIAPCERGIVDGNDAAGCNSESLSPDIREAMQAVVDFLYEDQGEDYQTRARSEQVGHVFESVLILQRWLQAPLRWR